MRHSFILTQAICYDKALEINLMKLKRMLADGYVQFHYSSAVFYWEDSSEFKFLKHYIELIE